MGCGADVVRTLCGRCACMTCLSMPHSCLHLIMVPGHLGVRLPATPAPLLRPNGGGQPWPCACAQGPTKLHASCRGAQPAHRDVGHLVNELQLGRYHGAQTSLDHGKPPLHHDKNDTTIFSTSCNCGSTHVFSTAAPENLQDHHNREIGHRVNELVNLFGQTTVWTVRSRLCASTGRRTTCTTCKQGHRSLAEELEKLCESLDRGNLPLYHTWKSARPA